jgi:hypothetical protein
VRGLVPAANVIDVTDPVSPVLTGQASSYVIPKRVVARKNITIDVRKQANGQPVPSTCADHVTAGAKFTGDVAVVGSYTTLNASIAFIDITDPVRPCELGAKILSANPETLNTLNRRGTFKGVGAARGVATITHSTGMAAYLAVAEVGVLAVDIGSNVPEVNYELRQTEGLYSGDYRDVAAIGGRLLAANNAFDAPASLDVFDASLSFITSVGLNVRPRRVITAEGVSIDRNLDGQIAPNEIFDLAFASGIGGVDIIDVTDPGDPVLIGHIDTPGIIRELAVSNGGHRLLAGGDRGTVAGEGFFIFDVSNPFAMTGPRKVYEKSYPSGIGGIEADDARGLVYVATGNGIDVLDVAGQFVRILDPISEMHLGVSAGMTAVGNGTMTWTTSDSSVVALNTGSGPTVTVEARALGHATVTVRLTGNALTTTASADITVGPLSILQIPGLSQTQKVVPGAVLAVNDDDDNANGQSDNNESVAVANENDLLAVAMLPVLPRTARGPVILDAAGANVRVWQAPDKQGGAITLPATFNSPADFPRQVFVEGLAASAAVHDVSLTAYYSDAAGQGIVDAVSLTVVKAVLAPVGPCCTGLDTSTTPPWLVVPAAGSKTNVAAAIAPADAASLLNLTSSAPGVVTATLGPSVTSGIGAASLADIHGVAEGEASLTLKVGQLSTASLNVSVRPERLVNVAFYYLSDGTNQTERPPTDADADLSIAKMNEIWSPQTNIKFVRRGSARTRTIPPTNGSIYVGFGICGVKPALDLELHSVLASADPDPGADINIFFVWALSDGATGGSDADGVTVCNGNNVLIINRPTHPFGFTEAHEAGHVFGLEHSDGDDLMGVNGTGNRISKAQSDAAHIYLRAHGH